MADKTLLNYSFQPPSVFISTEVDLTLSIQNPANGDPITFKGGANGDQISIVFPIGNGATDLVTELNFETRSPAGFNVAKSTSGEFYTIKFTNNSTRLQPGETATVTFLKVKVNDTCVNPASTAVITIKEYIRGVQLVGTTEIIKQPNNKLGISAWLDPAIVGLGQTSTLFWQSVGGTSVEVFPFATGKKKFPVEGPPPSPGNCTVDVPSTTESQRMYTLQVFTSDNTKEQTIVTLTQNPPLITAFTADKSGSIKVDDTLELDWFFLWGTDWMIDSNSGLELFNPNAPVKVNPGKEILESYKGNYANLPSSIYYTLTVNGFKEPTSKKISINLLPVQLGYFKYANNNLTGVTWKLNPESWKGYTVKTISENVVQLAVYQPGGRTDLYFLGSGDTHPQIQYFSFVKGANNSVEFSWVTANLASLVLTPGGYSILGTNIASGKKTVTVTATTVFTLTGTGNDRSTITSSIEVIV